MVGKCVNFQVDDRSMMRVSLMLSDGLFHVLT